MAAIEKRCPECGRELAVRTNNHTGEQFLGCVGYPNHCRYTEQMPESVKLRMSGAPTLPFME